MDLLLLVLVLQGRGGAARPPVPPAAPAPSFYTSPLSQPEMQGKQAVVETTSGTFVIEFLPAAAPNHVGFFMTQARAGAFNGTAFHRVIRNGMIQGGDPISTDPARTADYGSGGMNRLRAESKAEKPIAGAVAAVTIPGQPDSAGSQFFVLATDQPAVDGQYTIFARVVDGIEVVRQISAVEADTDGRPRSRVSITSVTIRDTPPVPFVNDSPAELSGYRVIVETTLGQIELEPMPDKAPETVRAFLRMADAGVYDGVGIHRVASNFVIQMGALAYRASPLLARQQELVKNLAPEFTDTPTVRGVVSMARGEDVNSGSTSFFICIGECRALDGKYTAFARVVGGDAVVSAIAAVPVDGETPRQPMATTRIRVEKK